MSKQNNIKYLKKAQMLEALLRIIVFTIVVYFVFSVGKEAAEAAFGDNMENEFNKFFDNIEKTDEKNKQIILEMAPNMAIVGFSANFDSYKCFGCGILSSTGSPSSGLSSYFKKPDNDKCKGKSCICLCQRALNIDKSNKPPYEIKCSNLLCRTLTYNLAGSVELVKYYEDLSKNEPQKYSDLRMARWEGGFLLERSSRLDTISNGLISESLPRVTVFAQKKQSEGNNYIVICPGLDCTAQPKQNIQTTMPEDICIKIDKCAKDTNIGITPKGKIECKYPTNMRMTFVSKQNCEKVEECVRSKINMNGQCEDDGNGDFAVSYNSYKQS